MDQKKQQPKTITLNREQQVMMAQRINEELEKMTMSWSNDLREWYPIAMHALDHANLKDLEIEAHMYDRLFEATPHGLNMNVVAALCNNVELRKPVELNMTAEAFRDVLALNNAIGKSWNALVDPVRAKVLKEIEIMANKPRMIITQ